MTETMHECSLSRSVTVTGPAFCGFQAVVVGACSCGCVSTAPWRVWASTAWWAEWLASEVEAAEAELLLAGMIEAAERVGGAS